MNCTSKCKCLSFQETLLSHNIKFSRNDYAKSSDIFAQNVLGSVLVRQMADGSLTKGIIVETEAYPGGADKASHSYNGKMTPRNEPMYMVPGTSYVYSTYGMYFCFNISCGASGEAVLIRALEPIIGVEIMKENRKNFRGSKYEDKSICIKSLCNGPAKLCISMGISKELNKIDLVSSDKMWLEKCNLIKDFSIVNKPRIGLNKSSAQEWYDKPLRYYIYSNIYVSKT